MGLYRTAFTGSLFADGGGPLTEPHSRIAQHDDLIAK